MAKTPHNETALLIDANSLIHRAWHALPPLTAPDGRVVNAAYGFASVLMKLLQTERPTYLVACWDTPEPTFRHKAKPEYKAQREEQPDEFYNQFPLTKQMVELYGGSNVELPGYEADDLLGTLATRFASKGIDVTLLTSDRDVWQMIGPHVRIMTFKKGVSETVIYDAKTLKDVTGLSPVQIADYKALRGDPSDNLKGVPGIGEKTATELLLSYKDFESIFKAAHNAKSELSPSLRKKLVDGEQEARETLPLVRLVLDAPLNVELHDLKRRDVHEDELRTVFTTLGFKTLLARALGGKKEERGEEKEKQVASSKKQGTTSKTEIAKSLNEILDVAKNEKRLIVHPVQAAQASLFHESPAIALGTATLVYLVHAKNLEKKDQRTSLEAILNDAEIKKIGHGLKLAWHWAHERGLELNGISFDTEIASYLLGAGEGGHDLETLAASRLNIFFSDTEDRPLAEVDAIRSLATELETELDEQGLGHFMARFETPLVPVLAQMEATGILIDVPYFKKLSRDFSAVKQQLEKELEKLAGEPFNPASPQQLGHILFDVLKISTKGIKHGKTGISTAASELEKLEGTHPIIEKIGTFREVTKMLSTYVDALPALADRDGRVHTTFNQVLTSTGRLSSTNPNMQNIPIRTELGRRIRHGFIAQKGFRLLSCDYSQIELRIVAALAHDQKMLEAFEKGLDIHTATAAAIWHIPLDEVTKDQRRAAKAVNFGIIYGQGPIGLSKSAGISFDEAKRFIEEYFHVYPGIREFLDQTKALARSRGYVETLFGRRRPIAEINSPRPEVRAAAERMAINMPVQGTGTADLPKLAMIEVAKQLPYLSKETRMLLQVHDELVFEVPQDEVKKVAIAVIDIMEHVEKIGVPIVVDAKEGVNWDEMKPVS